LLAAGSPELVYIISENGLESICADVNDKGKMAEFKAALAALPSM